MINSELAKIFYRISEILAADRVDFKPAAYRKAALSLEDLKEDVAVIYKNRGLKAIEEIPGIGQSIGQKIEEYILNGRIGYYEELKNRLPVNWEEFSGVRGVGPKRAKLLYEKLGIRNLADLEAAARARKISVLPGFGQKSEQNIIEGVEFRKMSRGRFLLGQIQPQAEAFKIRLEGLGVLERIDIAGSLRRKKETIGDVDLLAVPFVPLPMLPAVRQQGTRERRDTPQQKATSAAGRQVMDFFTGLPEVEKIWGKGPTKSSVRMKGGFNVDVRILPRESYGAALQYFTGSKDHNIALRRIAIEKGWKLSEYGLFNGGKMIAGHDEKEIYEKLGLQWIPPELRENRGEIEAAAAGKLPDIVGYGDLKGDLHCHSNLSDGRDEIKEMAQAAIGMGYEFIGISDHTKYLKIARGMDERAIRKRNLEIDGLNAGFRRAGVKFTILKGCEANIMDDGSIDISDESLRELDYVIAGVHTNFNLDLEKMTGRIIRAMENPNVDIISHLTGRKLKEREGYRIDTERIFDAARRTGTVLEINSNPQRLDLSDEHIRRALDYGVKMVVDTDAHKVEHLPFIEFGVAQARRGWAKASDIVNAHHLEKMLSFLKK